MRVKFLGNNTYYSDEKSPHKEEWCVINMAYFMLRHYYVLRGRGNDRVQWLPADLMCIDSYHDQILRLEQERPDVVAMSVHIWNEQLQHKLAREIKRQRPDTVIVMGGPQLTAHKDPEFFEKYPWVDWAVYGDGERPFQQILDHVLGIQQNTDNFVNCVHRDHSGARVVRPYEIIQDHEYLSTSPYLGQRQLIRDHVQYLVDRGIPRFRIKFAIEFARGCMYKCSFCDWSQNLTKKVKRRSSNWKQELDFFKEIGVSIRETDANFGQWDEDLEIFEYANSIMEPGNDFYFVPKNSPKTKKKAIHYLMKRTMEVHGINAMSQYISFQDIDTHVLDLVDRPSLGFQEQCDMIQQLRKDLNNDLTDALTAQFIIGMPGQSLDTLTTSITKVWNEAGIKKMALSHWEFLPNSPGADDDYIKKHGILTRPVQMLQHQFDLNTQPVELDNLDKLYAHVADIKHLNNYFSTTTIVEGTHTMNYKDLITIKLFYLNLLYMSDIKKTRHFEIDSKMSNALLARSKKQASDILEQSEPYVAKYGFGLLAGKIDKSTGKITSDSSNLPVMPYQLQIKG